MEDMLQYLYFVLFHSLIVVAWKYLLELSNKADASVCRTDDICSNVVQEAQPEIVVVVAVMAHALIAVVSLVVVKE